MNSAFLKAYEGLCSVYLNGSFSNVILNKVLSESKKSDRPLITKIVYGVLDTDIELDYIISKYVKKTPKAETLLFLKIGTFCLKYLSIPVYATVNDVAELSKITGDRRAVGFVNATLKSIASGLSSGEIQYPSEEVAGLSVKYSYPEWALKKLIKDYGKDVAAKIISCPLKDADTVRINLSKIDAEKFAESLSESELIPTVFADAFYLKGVCGADCGTYTHQSLASMAVARIAAKNCGETFLDCCSAPGGKSVYVKQLCPAVSVTACDLYAHRVELIESYAERMGVAVTTECRDMSVFDSEKEDKFDTVLCDVPCSGFGVLDTRPDIKLFRKNEDIASLMKLQYSILSVCSKYVKKGGTLIYSTCTVFDNENGQNIRKFLKENKDFAYGELSLPEFPQADGKPFYQFLPYKDNVQGFFVAFLRRLEQ